MFEELLAKPDSNEVALRKLFGGRMAFGGHQPVLSGPLTVMAFTNRSGSNLLADYLLQTEKFVGFGEYLNHPTVRNFLTRSQSACWPDYVTDLARSVHVSTAHNFGTKASANQMLMLLRNKIPAMFDGLHIIHIWRRDILAQAVSFDIASQTQIWTSKQNSGEARAEIKFDARRIENIIRGLQAQDKQIQYITSTLGLNLVSVCYEDLIVNPTSVIARIGDSFGFDLSDWVPKLPKIQKQSDAVNEISINNFRAMAARHV